MLSNFPVDVKENLSLKRKSECSSETSPLPPCKLQRLDVEPNYSKEEINQDFNSYQYWKDPLPDISFELQKITVPK